MKKYRHKPIRRRNRHGSIFAKQVIISIIIVLFVILLKKMDIAIVNKTMGAVKETLSQNYTLEKAVSAVNAGTEKLKSMPKTFLFSPPLDEKTDQVAAETQVHAIGGGTVSQIENHEKVGGRYIKILHDGEMESIYGNLENIYVKPLDKVKKGQIIGAVLKEEKKDFYFEIRSEGKTVDPSDYIDF
ncbi:MAG: M23 family metallopeptidase [Anaerovorax sp.]